MYNIYIISILSVTLFIGKRYVFMKKLLTFLLALALMLALSCAALASVDPGQSEYCKYGSPESPCHYWFACNSSNQQHYCYCTAHTEDKEDKYAFVFMYGPVPCTLANDVCAYCEHDYSPEFSASEMLISSIYEALERGRDVFDVSVSGNVLSVGFSDYMQMVMLEKNIATETLLVPTEYTLCLSSGSSYPYTGEPVEPAFLSVSEYGPGTLQEEYGLYMIDEISYTNNVNPGTATATVVFQFESLQGLILKELSVNFTIEGSSSSGEGGETGPEYCKYGSESSPCNIIYSVDRANMTHSRVCINHVEDKEDMYSHVLVSGPDACTTDEGGVCSGCGWDYIEDAPNLEEEAPYLVEVLHMLYSETGESPVVLTADGSTLTLSLSDLYIQTLEDFGLPISEATLQPTTYTLSLNGSDPFAYTGQPITPAVLTISETGAAHAFSLFDLLSVSGITYRSNVEPGTATAYVTVSLQLSGETIVSESFSISFTITGEGGEAGGEIKWPLPNAKTLYLPADLQEASYEAFAGIDAEVVVIPASCSVVAYDAFADCPNLQSVIFYGGNTEVNYAAFDGCGMITIFAPENSAVHQYALEMGYRYAPLSE